MSWKRVAAHKPILARLCAYLTAYDYACLYYASPALLRAGARPPIAAAKQCMQEFFDSLVSCPLKRRNVSWALASNHMRMTGYPVDRVLGTAWPKTGRKVVVLVDGHRHWEIPPVVQAIRNLEGWSAAIDMNSRRRGKYPHWLADEIILRKHKRF